MNVIIMNIKTKLAPCLVLVREPGVVEVEGRLDCAVALGPGSQRWGGHGQAKGSGQDMN